MQTHENLRIILKLCNVGPAFAAASAVAAQPEAHSSYFKKMTPNTHQALVWPDATEIPLTWRGCLIRIRRLFRLGLVVAFVTGVAAASGDSAQPVAASLVSFDIPAEPLIDALQAYSVQSGVQLLFETASAAGYQSAPVKGEFVPEVALRALLANTDLQIRYSRPTAIALAPASAPPDVDEPPSHALTSADMALATLRVSGTAEPDGRRFEQYIAAVQVDLQKALQKTAATRHGDYRISIKLWVDQSRTIQRAELQDSTGDHDRDGVIGNALRGLVLSQAAPANTPQPMRFMITISAP